MAATTWADKLQALRAIEHATWVGLIGGLATPHTGEMLQIRHQSFMTIRSGHMDGVTLGVAKNRSSCLILVQAPNNKHIVTICTSPGTLETCVPQVFQVLARGYTMTSH